MTEIPLNNHYGEYFTPISTLQGNARDITTLLHLPNWATQQAIQRQFQGIIFLKYLGSSNFDFQLYRYPGYFRQQSIQIPSLQSAGIRFNSDISNRAVNQFSKKIQFTPSINLFIRPELGKHICFWYEAD
jgi:hypothetical protein